MDCLRDWPEPVVRVQSIADSGAKTIPERYVKPPSDRPSHAADAGSQLAIPVIDLADDERMIAADVASACEEWGFFQAVNHGVSPALMRRAREAWRGFFHLPMPEKQRYANSPATYEGYGSRLGVEKGSILDWGDYYFLHLRPRRLMSHEKWPSLPPCLRETVDEYGRELIKLCERLMRVLSRGLGLDGGRLQATFGGGGDDDGVGVCMRVNFYPKCPQPELALGLSSHSDPGGLTVLLPDDRIKGLQVRKDGNWVTVEPAPDAFIVNIGDQIQVVSNAVYRSVEHRVLVNADAERLSIAFFCNPKSDIALGPLPELVTPDRPALYQPMTFDEYRLYIRKKGPRGKSQVESLEGER
ncbi:Leucoanthocyanidin dioxygenase [Ananas comosus]|uniref:Leucoanthocyanidin dioxygenase n=1 Tax=Ananas comosus TaxID=4615 RepID=A0A199VYY6_ANACO|nr:Leucoanthocyanidin dioxygenase [Ananas comosus]